MRRAPVLFVALAAAALSVAGCASSLPLGASVATAARTPSAPATPTPASAVRPSATGKLVFSGDRGVKKVALTFDLCETPSAPAGFDTALVDVLLAQQVPATFMMGGHWAETHAADARLLGATPFFEVGNHTYAHEHPTRIPTAAFRDEVELAQRRIETNAGVTPRVFRFPYGEHDATTLQVVTRAGLVPVQWNVETGDPDPDVSAADILGVVKRQTRNGSIVIMHANGRGRHTAEALPEVVGWLRAQGYELVTVSELLAPSDR